MAGDWLAPPLAFRSFFTGYLYHKHPETFVPKTIQISSDFSYVIFWHASVACFLKSYVLPFILPLFFSRNRVTPLQIPLFAPQEARHLYWPFRTSCPIKKHSWVDYCETDGDFIFYVFFRSGSIFVRRKANDFFFVRISRLLQSIIKYFTIEKITRVYRYDF